MRGWAVSQPAGMRGYQLQDLWCLGRPQRATSGPNRCEAPWSASRAASIGGRQAGGEAEVDSVSIADGVDLILTGGFQQDQGVA